MGVFIVLLNLLSADTPHNYAVGRDAAFIVLNTKAALKRGGNFPGSRGVGSHRRGLH